MISHSHKFIFIHIPKTGGTSLESVLAPFGTLLQGPGNFRSIYFKHIDAARLQPMLGAEYRTYYKFSIVRNPWDWLVSMYEFCRGFCYPFIYETDFTLQVPQDIRDMEYADWLIWFHERFGMQQCDVLTGCDGTIAVDKIFRFEGLADVSRELADTLGIEIEDALPKLKSSDRLDLDHYYGSGKTVDMVGRFFAKDIEMFDYRFDNIAASRT